MEPGEQHREGLFTRQEQSSRMLGQSRGIRGLIHTVHGSSQGCVPPSGPEVPASSSRVSSPSLDLFLQSWGPQLEENSRRRKIWLGHVIVDAPGHLHTHMRLRFSPCAPAQFFLSALLYLGASTDGLLAFCPSLFSQGKLSRCLGSWKCGP